MRTIIAITLVTLTEAFLSCSDICQLHGYKLIEGTPECLCITEDKNEYEQLDDRFRFNAPVKEYPYINTILWQPLYFHNLPYRSRNENKQGRNEIKHIFENSKRRLILFLSFNLKNIPFFLNKELDETILDYRFADVELKSINNLKTLEENFIDCMILLILVDTHERHVNSHFLWGNRVLAKYLDLSDSRLKTAYENKCVQIIKTSLKEIRLKAPRNSFDKLFHNEQKTKSNRKDISDIHENRRKNHLSHNAAATETAGKYEFESSTPINITPNTSYIPLTTLSQIHNTFIPSTIREDLTKTFPNQATNMDNHTNTDVKNNDTVALSTLSTVSDVNNFTVTKSYQTSIKNMTPLALPYLINEAITESSLGSNLVSTREKESTFDHELINDTFEIKHYTSTDNNNYITSSSETSTIDLPSNAQTEIPITLYNTERYIDKDIYTERYIDSILIKRNTGLWMDFNSPPTLSVSDTLINTGIPTTVPEEYSENFQQNTFISEHNRIKLVNTMATLKTQNLENIKMTRHNSTSNKGIEKILATSTKSNNELNTDKGNLISFLPRDVTRCTTAKIEKLKMARSTEANHENRDDKLTTHSILNTEILKVEEVDFAIINNKDQFLSNKMNGEKKTHGNKDSIKGSFTTMLSTELEPIEPTILYDNNQIIESKTFETKSTTRTIELDSAKQTIDGELNFIFRGFSIPIRLLQNGNGKIKIGVDGDTLCDKILDHGLNDSIIISILCKCLKTNTCGDSFYKVIR